jgi:hypothetical protein
MQTLDLGLKGMQMPNNINCKNRISGKYEEHTNLRIGD